MAFQYRAGLKSIAFTCLIVLQVQTSFAASLCSSIFTSTPPYALPEELHSVSMLGVVRTGSPAGKGSALAIQEYVVDHSQAKLGSLGSIHATTFSKDFIKRQQLAYENAGYASPNSYTYFGHQTGFHDKLNFVYEQYRERAFKSNELVPTEFVQSLITEDGARDDFHYSYVILSNSNPIGKAHEGNFETIAYAQTVIKYPGELFELPVMRKIPKLQELIQDRFPRQPLIEIGRLAKLPSVDIKFIFGAISQLLIQRGIRRGQILGHAARAQTAVYRRLKFNEVFGEEELGADHHVVQMSVADFIERFPPISRDIPTFDGVGSASANLRRERRLDGYVPYRFEWKARNSF